MSEVAAAAPNPAPVATDATSVDLGASTSEPVSAMSHGLDALLSGVELADPTEATETGEAADTDGAEPADAKDAPKGREAPDELIFSDEQLQTPDGIKRAKARVGELRKMQHQKYLELKGYEKHVRGKAEKFNHKLNQFKSEKQSHDLLLNNVRSNLQGLHSGDPETILTALGNLTGTDGFKAYELLTSRIVNKGRAPLDPQIQAMLDQQSKEIEALKTERVAEKSAARVRQLDQQLEAHEQNIGRLVRESTTTPHLTRIFNDDPARLTKAIVKVIEETNGSIPARELFAQMEDEIRAASGGAPPQGTSGGTAPKQLTSAQSSPGRSVGPSTAAAATTRAPTEQEILRNLANDTELLASLGL